MTGTLNEPTPVIRRYLSPQRHKFSGVGFQRFGTMITMGYCQLLIRKFLDFWGWSVGREEFGEERDLRGVIMP